MTFKLLSTDLHPTAEAAEKFFRKERGATGFQHEQPLDARLALRPTLVAQLPDKSLLCVEVSEKAYSNSLDTFVIEACAGEWPILLYVAIPTNVTDPQFAANLRKAKTRGVGVAEFGDGTSHVYHEALRLSLFGLRSPTLTAFPRPKRQIVALAEGTFREGNPVKGCQAIYEEIEAVTRAFAQHSRKQGWWRPPRPGDPKVIGNLDNGAWARVLENLSVFLDHKLLKSHCPKLTTRLVASTMGLTDPRNATTHKPKSARIRSERDRHLRTWFEQAADVLRQWYSATHGLRL